MTDKKSTYEYTKHFCESFDQVSGDNLSEEEWSKQATLRADLIFEEFLELLQALGVGEYYLQALKEAYDASELEREELNRKEMVDALGDLDVVVNNAALFFGVDMREVSKRVYESNMSKLLDNEEEADKSIRSYHDKGVLVGKKQNEFGKWYVYNIQTGKRLKGIHFQEPNLTGL